MTPWASSSRSRATQRHPSLNVIEAVRAGHQLAQYQRRPASGEDLGRLRDRAKLTIAFQHVHQWTTSGPRQPVRKTDLLEAARSITCSQLLVPTAFSAVR